MINNIRHSATFSFAEKLNKGTQSSLQQYIETKLEMAKNSPNFKFTPIDQSKSATHNFSFDNLTNKLASNSANRLASKHLGAVHNPDKKFYALPNDNTKQLDAKPLSEFISQLSNKSDAMLKSKNVTVNGIKITDPNYQLKSGDIVRIGVGHFVNNSELIAIVK